MGQLPIERVAIRYDKFKVAFWAIAALTLTALIVWLMLLPRPEPQGWVAFPRPQPSPWLKYGFGSLGTVFFGLGSLRLFAILLDRSPAVLLDQQGMVIRTGYPFFVRRVSWGDVDDVRSATSTYWVRGIIPIRSRFVAVIIRNPEEFVRRHSALWRWTLDYRKRKLGSPIIIDTNLIEMTADELAVILKRYVGA
jgi:hypothetical protein